MGQTWLEGGPFLEVSFLLNEVRNDKRTILQIVNKILELNTIQAAEENIEERAGFFEVGYDYDDESNVKMHSFELPLYIFSPIKRKSLLKIDRISSNALMVNFLFFGSVYDAPEWGQIGIRKKDVHWFILFLKNLYSIFDFKVGGIAIERDIIDLFKCHEGYPSECYLFEKLNPPDFLKEDIGFGVILWNNKYQMLDNIPFPVEGVGNDGVLINIGNSFSI